MCGHSYCNYSSSETRGYSITDLRDGVITGLEPEFLENWWGYGNRNVQFIGHGVGLEIAENPVLSKGFDSPLEEGMVIAIEPKKGIKRNGMVGIENICVVTPDSGRRITGHSPRTDAGRILPEMIIVPHYQFHRGPNVFSLFMMKEG
jgi:hypothetical protein